jgi:hypothetical protein
MFPYAKSAERKPAIRKQPVRPTFSPSSGFQTIVITGDHRHFPRRGRKPPVCGFAFANLAIDTL